MCKRLMHHYSLEPGMHSKPGRLLQRTNKPQMIAMIAMIAWFAWIALMIALIIEAIYIYIYAY